MMTTSNRISASLSQADREEVMVAIATIKEKLQQTDRVYSVAFSPARKQIVSGSLDNTVRLWNCNYGQADWTTLHRAYR